jgi:SNF2 family DNA or RNA helicase
VFLLDPWWNPAAEAQAYDRAHRIGQTKSVFVYKFITKGSIEEKILKLQEQKLLLSDKMLENDEDSIIKQLDVEAVMKLIE